MKKIISLVGMLAAVVLLLASCSKENSSSIIGTWRLEETVTTTYIDGTLYDSHVSTHEGESLIIEFKSDGTMTMIEKTESKISTSNGSYMIIENTLILNFNQLGIGDKIEVASETVTIDSITSTTLVFSSETSYSNGGKNYTSIGKATLKRVK